MKKFTINKEQASYLLGVTVKSLTAWQKKKENALPVLKVGKRGQSNQYDPRELLKWTVANELSKVVLIHGERLDLDEQRARLAKEQTETAALKNAQTRRELAPIVQIEWVLGKVGSEIAAILEGIPLKVKRRVQKLTASDIGFIRREVVKALNVASKITINLDDYGNE